MTARRLGYMTAMVCAVSLLLACSATQNSGALAVSDPKVEVCTEDMEGVPRALGITWISNKGSEPVTVISIEPTEAHGFTSGESYLVPDSDNAFANGIELPPTEDENTMALWKQRKAAIDTKIQPGETWQVVKELTATSPDARFDALEVTYEQNGVRFSGRNGTSVRTADASGECHTPFPE